MLARESTSQSADARQRLLKVFSVEITPGDEKSLNTAARELPKGTEVFIASLPKGHLDAVVDAAARLRRDGLVPVPHLAARNLASGAQLDELLRRLSAEANVDRALVIGGDRDEPLGPYECSLQLLNSNLLQRHGIGRVYLSSYPEGHPRIDDHRLAQARTEKLAAAEREGFEIGLISQVCFESSPMIDMVRQLRQQGVRHHVRIGLAGPTKAVTLLKYALVCGVGPSIRALREKDSMAKNILGGGTEGLLAELARAQSDETLAIGGIHFFTFGSLSRTTEMLARLQPLAAPAIV
jgi:methylenetetrahydrofolate reductase (NADPH)